MKFNVMVRLKINKNKKSSYYSCRCAGIGWWLKERGNLFAVSVCWNQVVVKGIMAIYMRSRCAGIFPFDLVMFKGETQCGDQMHSTHVGVLELGDWQ